MNFSDLYHQSINDKQAFWGEQAKRIYWHQQPTQILDDSKLPFAKWFVGGGNQFVLQHGRSPP